MSDDTKEWLASEALRLGNEVRDLSISNAVLRDDNAKLKDENEELHKDYESLADEHTKLIDRNKTLKDELRKRALDSLSDIGQLGEQSAEIARLKAEVERLRQAGDALEQEVIGCYFEQDEPADSESLRAWRAAKEDKPSV
jgi:cell division protein FtsB